MKQLLLEFKKMDNSILSLIKSGLKFCFGLSIVSDLILLAYDFLYTSPILYYIGISLFKTSLFFMVGFIICGLAFHKIIEDLKN